MGTLRTLGTALNDFLEELARVELEPDEVREILRRMATEEFQTSGRATVLDVSEATGAAPEAVMRMLAELRGRPWETWKREIESSVREHARRLQALESAPRAPARPETDAELYERVERARQEKHATSNTIVYFVAIVLFFLVLGLKLSKLPAGRGVSGHRVDEWYPGLPQTSLNNGPAYGYNGACVWSEEQANGKPGPITNQQAADDAMMSLGSRSNLRCPP